MRCSKSLFSTVVQTNLSSTFKIPDNATVFSMIQPTGVFHVGNYLGAIKSWVDIANDAPSSAKIIYGIADLHAITVPKEPESLRKYRHQALASILASGVDPNKCILYFQSAVPAHVQLHWILSTIAGMGYLNRMVQWKSKIGIDESANIDTINDNDRLSKLHLGLFSYPVLQAADILLHKASLVPVGDDQSQHLELTRYITSTFNHRFSRNDPIFPVPSTLLAPFKKILSLRDTTKKMSKSDPDQNGCLYITDTPEIIQKKVKKAVTDSSQDPVQFSPSRPGVSNLILMAAGVTGLEPEKFLNEYLPQPSKDHRELKNVISQVMIEHLSPIRKKYEELKENRDYLEFISKKGAEYAQESGEKTIDQVYKAIGLR